MVLVKCAQSTIKHEAGSVMMMQNKLHTAVAVWLLVCKSLLYAPPAMVKKEFATLVGPDETPTYKEGRQRYWLSFPVRFIFPEMADELTAAGDPDRSVQILVEMKNGQTVYQRIGITSRDTSIVARNMDKPAWLMNYKETIKTTIDQISPPLDAKSKEKYVQYLDETFDQRLWFDTTAEKDFLEAANFIFVDPAPLLMKNTLGGFFEQAADVLPTGIYYTSDMSVFNGLWQVTAGSAKNISDPGIVKRASLSGIGYFVAVAQGSKKEGRGDSFWRGTCLIKSNERPNRLFVLAGSKGKGNPGDYFRSDIDTENQFRSCPSYDCEHCMPPTTSVLSVDFSLPEVREYLFEYVAPIERTQMNTEQATLAATEFFKTLRHTDFEHKQKEDEHLRGVVTAFRDSNRIQFIQTWNNNMALDRRELFAGIVVDKDSAFLKSVKAAQSGELTAVQKEIQARLLTDRTGNFVVERKERRITDTHAISSALTLFSNADAKPVAIKPFFQAGSGPWWDLARDADRLETLLLKIPEHFKCTYDASKPHQQGLINAARRQLQAYNSLDAFYQAVETGEYGGAVGADTKTWIKALKSIAIPDRTDADPKVLDVAVTAAPVLTTSAPTVQASTPPPPAAAAIKAPEKTVVARAVPDKTPEKTTETEKGLHSIKRDLETLQNKLRELSRAVGGG